jgi:hypothetical protein
VAEPQTTFQRRRTTEPRTRVAGGGSDWLPRDMRHAIYARDGHACACCGIRGGRNGAGLTADHIRSQHGEGGESDPRNLITMCNSCNSSKQDRPLREWARTFLARRGHDPEQVISRINELSQHHVDLELGERLAQEEAERRKPPLYNNLVMREKARMAANAQRERETGRANTRNRHPLDLLRDKAEASLLERAGKHSGKRSGPAPVVQRGRKGGTFVVTKSGEKRYVKKA